MIFVKPKPFERKKITIKDFEKGIQSSRIKAKSNVVIGHYFDEMLKVFLKHPEYFYSEEQLR